MDNTKCKYLKPTFGFMLCAEYEHQTHCCDIKDCYFKQSSAYQQQYSAVVAQNKSLQMELRLYKKMVEILALTLEQTYSHWAVTKIDEQVTKRISNTRNQALQELEAEND